MQPPSRRPIIRFGHALALVEEAFTSLLLLAIVVLVFVAAVTRYFGTPINWSVDVAQALFVWLIYVGAHQALLRGQHIGVSFFVDRLHPNVKAALYLLTSAVIAWFLVMIIWHGTQVSIINVRRILQNIPVSYSWVTMAAPVGAFLMLLTTLARMAERLIALVRALRRGETIAPLPVGGEGA
jgi:TRAP-type C4-dicarboxylate transport system permease small subunit